jgi:predicted GNAT family acetyltransferase
MTTPIRDNPERSRYELLLDDAVAGFVDYRIGPDWIALTHTEVDPAYEGQGLGRQLARHALDDARSRGLRVRPVCPYITTWIRRHPEYADLTDAPSDSPARSA